VSGFLANYIGIRAPRTESLAASSRYVRSGIVAGAFVARADELIMPARFEKL